MVGGRLDAVAEYYRAVDEHAYDALAEVLAAGFVHVRPDTTLEGRDRFVEFMRSERPMQDTTHEVDAVYTNQEEVAVRGRLVRDDRVVFGFVDVFGFADEKVARVQTFTR